MPRLHYANRLDRLVSPLAQLLDRSDPFEPPVIAVPNFSLQKWLSLQLAQRLGIAANLRFVLLEKALQETLQEALQKSQGPKLRQPLTSLQLQRLLIALLREIAHDPAPLWEPVRQFLQQEASSSLRVQERRLFQLAEKLGHLMQQYEYNREDMLRLWQKKQYQLPETARPLEAWQQEIWNRLFGETGLVARFNAASPDATGRQLGTLPRFFEEWRQQTRTPQAALVRPRLHLFGFSYLSAFHQKVLTQQVEQVREVCIYTLNPCMEFWEDLEPYWKQRQQFKKRPDAFQYFNEAKRAQVAWNDLVPGELLQNESDHPLLQAWGYPGRENIRMLNRWGDWDFFAHFRDPLSDDDTPASVPVPEGVPERSVLQHLQHDLLVREPRRFGETQLKLAPDASVEVVGCPTIRREVEQVANRIWELVQTHSGSTPLRFNEIAVIAPDLRVYQWELEQVFRSLYRLPYHLVDGHHGASGALMEAARQLLHLGLGDVSRREVLNLLQSPCFLKTLKTPSGEEAVDPEAWIRWSEELGIYFGKDAADFQERGYAHLPEQRYHWQQGFQRLALGSYLETESDSVSWEEQEWVPGTVGDDEAAGAAQFQLIVQSLLADARFLAAHQDSAQGWSQLLHRFLSTYLQPADDYGQEEFQRLLETTQTFANLEVLPTEDAPLSYPLVLEFFMQQYERTRFQRGHYLAEGVTISPFQPMRPIPFRVVFILGLQEGAFPSKVQEDQLDLRDVPVPGTGDRTFRRRLIGDVSPMERDHYQFLETLISTSESLILSFLSQDEKGEPQRPSSLIELLLETLNTGYLAQPMAPRLLPVTPYDASYFPELQGSASPAAFPQYSLEAFRQARAQQLRKQLERHLPLPDRPELWAALRPHLPHVQQSEPADAPLTTERLTLTQLRQFLENPLVAQTKRALRLASDEEDLTDVEEEPFHLNALEETLLFRETMGQAFSVGVDWVQAYEMVFQRWERLGKLPPGILQEGLKKQHLEVLTNWEDQVKQLMPVGRSLVPRRLVMGPLSKWEVTEWKRAPEAWILGPPLHLQGVTLSGATGWWLCEGDQPRFSLQVVRRKVQASKAPDQKEWLQPFLELVALQAAGRLTHAFPRSAVLLSKEDLSEATLHLPDPDAGWAYLNTILTALQTERFDFLYAASEAQTLQDALGNPATFNRKFQQKMQQALSAEQGFRLPREPFRFLEDLAPPEDAHALTRQRLNLYFQHLAFPESS